MDYSIAIIGGGASGLAAAVSAAGALRGDSVCVLERMDRVGKKLLATGNGRCNLSNMNLKIINYHGSDLSAAEVILNGFAPVDAIKFFYDAGLLCKVEDDGKIYPYCYQASAVLDALRNTIADAGVRTVVGFEAAKLEARGGGYAITARSGEEVTASKVIVAAGGLSYPSLGGSGSGMRLLKSLGHAVTPVAPALAQLTADDRAVKALAGIKFFGTLGVVSGGETIDRQTGEILFTDYGLSGIPALEASKYLYLRGGVSFYLDFMPDYSEEEIVSMLRERMRSRSDKTLEYFLSGLINKKIGFVLLKRTYGGVLSRPVSSLSDGDVIKLSRLIKTYSIEVTGARGWNGAQVTAGGVPLSEFTERLESKYANGVYAAGEVLDVFGDCGGYNLHWAWASGRAAGTAAAETVLYARDRHKINKNCGYIVDTRQ